MQLGVRSYYSVDRAPVKFRRIRSPFDCPTVKHSATVAGTFVGCFRSPKTLIGLHFSSLFSAQGLSSQPTPTLIQPTKTPSDPEPSDSNLRLRNTPQTLANLLYMDTPFQIWQPTVTPMMRLYLPRVEARLKRHNRIVVLSQKGSSSHNPM